MSVNPSNNEIQGVSGLSYDPNGNASTSGMTYDAENRLATAGGLQYLYDGQNERIWSWSGEIDGSGNPTGYSVSMYSPNGQKLATYQLTPTWLQGYTPAMWMQVTLASSDQYFGGRRLAVLDQLGSVGTYFPWGEDKGSTNPQNTWSYATYWRDAVTNLDYANNRYYSNAYGRFMTPDPYQASGGPADPGSWNRYTYTRGDPVNRRDPRGLLDCLDCGSGDGGYCDPSIESCAPLVGGDGLGPSDFVATQSRSQILNYLRIQLALQAAARLAINSSISRGGPIPTYLDVAKECWAPAVPSAGAFRYTLEVTYQILGSNGQPIRASSLGGISISENFFNVTGNTNIENAKGTWTVYQGSDGIQSGGTFTDYLSPGGGLSMNQGMAFQTFSATGFLSNGLPLLLWQPLTVIGFGSPTTVLDDTFGYSPAVTINGLGLGTNPATECN